MYWIRIAKALLLLQILLATWLCSGTRTECLLPMFITSISLFLSTHLSGFFYNTKSIFLKSLIYSTILFIVLSLIQYNNPYSQYIKLEDYSYTKALCYIDFLPSSVRASFDNGNAFSALTIILTSFLTTISAYTIYNKSTRFLYTSIYWFLLNSICMGTFAIFQRIYEFPYMYNIASLISSGAFYGSFFNENATGAYINMAIAVSMFCMFDVFKESKFKFIILTTFTLLLSISTYFSHSKAAILLMFLQWLILLLTIAYIIARKFTKFIIPIISIFTLIPILTLSSFQLKNEKERSINTRIQTYEYAFNMIKKRPIFGWGGNCVQYTLPKFFITSKSNKKLYNIPFHSHSDVLEYTLSYGIIGLIALLFCGISWLTELYKYRKHMRPKHIFLFTGTICCLIHSSIDMGLSIPATMIAFGLLSVFSVITLKENKNV